MAEADERSMDAMGMTDEEVDEMYAATTLSDADLTEIYGLTQEEIDALDEPTKEEAKNEEVGSEE